MTDPRIVALEAFIKKLEERTRLGFMADCKCGNCQLVEAKDLDTAIALLRLFADGLKGGRHVYA